MAKNVDKEHLKQFLDQQIAAFSKKKQQKPTFDSIETKLKKIEQKLLGLRIQSEPKFQQSHAQQTSLVKGSSYNSQQIYFAQKTPQRKEQRVSIIKTDFKQDQSQTPAKRLNIVSKIMSETHLATKSLANTQKTTKRPYTSAKKIKIVQNNVIKNLFQKEKIPLKKNKTKSSRTFNTFNQTINRTSNQKNKLLQKDLQYSWKCNTELRRKVNQLRGYQMEYWKLKQIFDQCEKLRRKRKNIEISK